MGRGGREREREIECTHIGEREIKRERERARECARMPERES